MMIVQMRCFLFPVVRCCYLSHPMALMGYPHCARQDTDTKSLLPSKKNPDKRAFDICFRGRGQTIDIFVVPSKLKENPFKIAVLRGIYFDKYLILIE